MRRRLLVLLLATAAGLAGAGRAAALPFTSEAKTIQMSDGVALDTRLYTPFGLQPLAGWPAIVMFHGLGGSKEGLAPIAEHYFAPNGYATLIVSLRGHGASGGRVSIDGPREQQDVREIYNWLSVQEGIDPVHIGVWGISLGGGLVWHAAIDGVPFAAFEPVITWTDLYRALFPGNLAKAGALFGFIDSVKDRLAPEVEAIRTDAFASTNLGQLRALTAARSSLPALNRVHAPVFMIQGRRDFAFDITEATSAFKRLRGPKRLYIGDLGHAPAANPPAEVDHYLTECRQWFDRWLKGEQNNFDKAPDVEIARDPWTPATHSFAKLPRTRTLKFAFKGKATIPADGKVVRTSRLRSDLETFGPTVVRVAVSTRTRWDHLVAVLSARTPSGDEVLLSEGGVLTRAVRKRPTTVRIRLIDDATFVPAGSTLKLTLAATSEAQDARNVLYLLGVPKGSALKVGRASVELHSLTRPISG